MNYQTENHSKHLLTVHLVFVCKYRKKLLTRCAEEIKDIMEVISIEHNFRILKMETDRDHIHLLVQYHPKQSVLELVRLLKQISTYRIWRQNDNASWLSLQFWKEKTFWSDGYFSCSVGNASAEAVKKYIESQG